MVACRCGGRRVSDNPFFLLFFLHLPLFSCLLTWHVSCYQVDVINETVFGAICNKTNFDMGGCGMPHCCVAYRAEIANIVRQSNILFILSLDGNQNSCEIYFNLCATNFFFAS